MGATVQTRADLAPDQIQATRWGLPSHIAFRFCVLYFGSFCLLTPILWCVLPIPTIELPDLSTLPPFRQIVFWTAQHIFRYQQPLVFTDSGSGDKVFDWVLSFCLLVFALIAAAIWSVLDQRRANYQALYKWFRVFTRFALAGTLFSYGMFKIIPVQMPFPNLVRLLEPYGNFSPMGALWYSIGAAPAYERFVGSAELLAGLLLVVPATSVLGALICIIDMTEVFVVNMTYDVPVKLFSFHLLLMAAFLLIPERSRVIRFCFSNCAVPASDASRLFNGVRASRIAIATQLLFGSLLFCTSLYGAWDGWFKWGGGAPKSPLYGIWNVDEMTIDGTVRAPLLTDYARWRRVIFDSPQNVMFERMDDSFASFGSTFDKPQSALTLTNRDDKRWKGLLNVHSQGVAGMTLDGEMGQHKVRMQLTLMDHRKFLLTSRGFHWIQDYPFNR